VPLVPPPTGSTASPTRIWAALATVYLVWGSTYLAIRVAVDTLPPFSSAAVRFLVAGTLLTAITAARGDWRAERIGLPQWRAAAIVGGALLLGGNGGVVWAEQRIPSGVAALLVAMLPLWVAVLERLLFGRRLARRAVVGLALGFAGVALLLGRPDGGGVDPIGAAACMGASASWACGSLYARTAPLPRRPLVATSMEMLAGGLLLGIAGATAGELSAVRPDTFSTASVLALAYLVVFGSLVAFSTFVWLLHNAPLPLVATYAYVNPVVAVLLGWAILGELLTLRLAVAGAVVVTGVALIASAVPPAPPVDAAAPPARG
jgi:drug/metabolite transporter (DMT)-like permease